MTLCLNKKTTLVLTFIADVGIVKVLTILKKLGS